MSESSHKSVLALKARTPLLPGIVLAALFHALVLFAVIVLPKIFDRPSPIRKPIMARMIALGKPRDPHLLPRKDSPPPPAAPVPSPVSAPSLAPSAPSTPAKTAPSTPAKKEPSRQQLMERALARASGKAVTESKEAPDPERAGQATGSAQGTAESASEGDAYFTAVHDAILENYVVPSVISERERLYLTATVIAFIGPQGQILKHELQKKSGNNFFDQALELAIQRTKLPAPPPELVKSLRDNGVEMNFKP